MHARSFAAAVAAVLFGFNATPAHAACPPDEAVSALAGSWAAKTPAPAALAGLATLADAYCAQDKLVTLLAPKLGGTIGYKAGLTAKPVQERFGVNEPARGILLKGMLLDSGTAVPAAFGARPVWEADMLLVVKDAGINAAASPADILAHISAMRPFIELPDLVFAPGVKLDGLQLTAINVGARLGVAGKELPLANTEQTAKALETVKIVATDGTGAARGEGVGAAVLGSPLAAAHWLVTNLKAAGIALKQGDLLSVGSFTPLTPPKAGEAITVRYVGLPGGAVPEVTVRFE